MKTAVLVFIEHQLGGLGTQAIDLAQTAYELAGCGKVVTFAATRNCYATPLDKFTARFGPTPTKRGLAISDCKVSTDLRDSANAYGLLAQFDRRIWIGVAPHCKTSEEVAFYSAILSDLPGKDYAFATDRYIDELYPWVIPQLRHFEKIYSFADTYANAIRRHAPVEVLPIAPLQAWRKRKYTAPSTKPRALMWPHQWRGWKNIEMFLEMAPRLDAGTVDMFASGSGIEYSHFRNGPLYADNVIADAKNPRQHNPRGTLRLRGFVPNETVLQAYTEHACVPDLTGISKVRREPNSYVGNYQCATLEPMAFGCALLKFSTTVAPHNCIPREAVCVLEPEQKDYAPIINDMVKDKRALDCAAENAFQWLEANCDPYKLYERAFLQ